MVCPNYLTLHLGCTDPLRDVVLSSYIAEGPHYMSHSFNDALHNKLTNVVVTCDDAKPYSDCVVLLLTTASICSFPVRESTWEYTDTTLLYISPPYLRSKRNEICFHVDYLPFNLPRTSASSFWMMPCYTLISANLLCVLQLRFHIA